MIVGVRAGFLDAIDLMPGRLFGDSAGSWLARVCSLEMSKLTRVLS